MPEEKIVTFGGDRLSDGVVDLADFRIARGHTTRPAWGRCKHRKLVYDQTERRVHCQDCDRDIEAFDALMSLTGAFTEMLKEVERRQEAARVGLEHTVRSRAAKAVDHVWSGHKMAPCCPHCSRGLLPEDFAGGAGSQVSREYELALRKRKKEAGDAP